MVTTLEDKKGEDILLLDIHEVTYFADYFILCNGTSDRMLSSLAQAVVEAAKSNHKLRGTVQGQPQDGWIVVDLGDIVVHLFSPDQRDYYRLEQLWESGRVLLRVQ
ncbi:MAG: ribosome silencing factor [Chloroflexi bacterium]|nr:ribosome silencing factor [Chloroflexota bacterium]